MAARDADAADQPAVDDDRQAAKDAAVREAGITAAQRAALAVLSDWPGIIAAERGTEVFAQADALVAKLDARLAEGLTPDELASVRDLLARIVRNAEAPDA
ncbi:hypothetical protein ACFXG6_34295 [Streptomyces roseus]|uniref:hypothetical protein n=1 Tax=Streptomyces roseus TaxID=66430 RepID=UPI0036BF9024